MAAVAVKAIKHFKCFPRILSSATTSRKLSYQTLPNAAYGGRHTVTMLAGDGVGPELMGHLKEVFRFAGAPVDFEEIQLDASVTDDTEVENALLSIKRNGVAIKGNVTQPGEQKSRNVELRKELDLFANIVHCKSIPGIETRHSDIDIVIIRENTEGEYKQLEHENVRGVVESLKIITRENSLRIATFAFEFARQHGRKKVTAVHKANIMKLGDGMFLHCCEEVSKEYPDIQFEAMIIDNCSMQMVSRPQQFDVMVMPNLYGNIVSNIGAGLVGGPGVVAGMNLGEQYAVFEMGTRNVGIAIKNLNIANPSAILLAGAEMLDYLGLTHHSTTIKDAVNKVLSEQQIHTPDLGGTATTTDMVQAIIKEVQSSEFRWY